MDVLIWSCCVGQSVIIKRSLVFQSGSGSIATLQISTISSSVNPRPDRSNSSRTSIVHLESISSVQPLSSKYRRPLEIAEEFGFDISISNNSLTKIQNKIFITKLKNLQVKDFD